MVKFLLKPFLVVALCLVHLQGGEGIPKKTPSMMMLQPFTGLAHGIRSGNVIIKDTKTIYIQSLHYDGAGPDAFFWVGTGPKPHSGGQKIPNELGSLDVLGGYRGQDVELILPGQMTVKDIDWIAVWCVAFKENFGYLMIPKNLDVPEPVDL